MIPDAAEEWASCEICAHAFSDHADGDECLAKPGDYHGRGDSACPCERFATRPGKLD